MPQLSLIKQMVHIAHHCSVGCAPRTTYLLTIIMITLILSPTITQAENRLIQYSFTLQNETNQLIKEVDFQCFLPLETFRQQRLNVTTSHPYTIESLSPGNNGNDHLQFKLTNFAPFSSKIVQVIVQLQTIDDPQDSKANADCFLKPQKYIESDNPEITRLAKKLKRKTVAKTVKSIYHWVSGNIYYSGYTKNMRGALYALQHKAGDCSEYAALFVALCRANGIPARTMAGFICAQNCILKPSSLHNWAEFQLDHKWRIADPQNKKFMKNETNYIAVGCAPRTNKDNNFNQSRFKVSNPAISVRMNN